MDSSRTSTMKWLAVTLIALATFAAELEHAELPKPDAPFVVYDYEGFDKVPTDKSIRVYESNRDLAKRLKRLIPFIGHDRAPERLAATLQKTPNGRRLSFTTLEADGTNKLPTIVKLEVGTGHINPEGHTLGGDQYITVTFSDGSTVWYKQPRWARGCRDRPDVWVRGRMGMSAWLGMLDHTQHFVADSDHYPEQLMITRDRVANDPEHDVDYTGRADVVSKAAAAATTVAGAVAAYEAWAACSAAAKTAELLPVLTQVLKDGLPSIAEDAWSRASWWEGLSELQREAIQWGYANHKISY